MYTNAHNVYMIYTTVAAAVNDDDDDATVAVADGERTSARNGW